MLHPLALLAAAGSITCSLVAAALTARMDEGDVTQVQESGSINGGDGAIFIMPADGTGLHIVGDGGPGGGPLFTFSTGQHSLTAPLAELLRPEFLRRDARLYQEALRLHESQLPIIRLLLESYGEEFGEAAAELRSAIDRRQHSRLIDLTGGLALGDGIEMPAGALNDIAVPIIRAGSAVAALNFSTSPPPSGETEVVELRVARRARGPAASEGAAGETGGSAAPAAPQISVAVSSNNGEAIELRIDDEDLAALAARINERLRRAQQRAAEARARLEAEGPIPTAADVYEMARKFRATRDALAAQFRDDLSLILGEWQQELLEHAHVLQLLDAQLPHGRLSGESLDLRALVEQLAPQSADGESLAATLGPWMQETAQMMAQRMHHAIELELAELKGEAAVEKEREPQHARTLALARNLAATRERIASHTEEILQTVLRMVDDADEATLLLEARRRAFPAIFRTSQVLAIHDEALTATKDDEDPALHDAIAAMRSEYEQRLHDFNHRLVTLTRDSDVQRLLLPYEMRARSAAMRSAEDPTPLHEEMQHMIQASLGGTSAVMRDRTTTALAAIELLRSVLGDERFGELPGTASFPRHTK